MKQILTIIVLLGTALGVAAQSSGNAYTRRRPYSSSITVDSSYVEIIYHYGVYDPVLDEKKDDFKMLQIGKNMSKYGDYGGYQVDSIMELDYPDGVTFDEYHKVSVAILPSWEAYVKVDSTGTVTTYDKVFTDKYFYEEPLKLMEWTLQPDTATICGHTCRKATTSFRGRNWTAWYAPDVPIDNGPWKFGGLPGLILKVDSDDKEQQIEATAIRQNKRRIVIDNKRHQRTTREKFNKELEEYMTRPRQFHIANPTMAPKDKDGNIATPEFRRLFFNPIELE